MAKHSNPDEQMAEIFRKSPALEVASKLLGDLGQSDDHWSANDPILADRFLEDSYRYGRLMSGRARLRNDLEHEMVKYRAALKRANRFYLDDEFTEMATRASTLQSSDQLAKRLHSAVLPYETTWIEFNLRKKVQTTIELSTGPNRRQWDVSPRMGVLLQRDADYPTAWSMTMFTEVSVKDHDTQATKGYMVAPGMVVYLFDAAKHPNDVAGYKAIPADKLGPALMATPWSFYTRSDDPGLPEGSPKLRPLDGYGEGERKGETFSFHTPEVLNGHAGMTLSHTGRLILSHIDRYRDESDVEFYGGMYRQEANELAGMLRWMVTVLAMLAEVPVKQAEPVRAKGSRLVGTLRRPYMEYHKLSIKLPKTKPLQYIERKLDKGEARHHRAHEVRSHWRTYIRNAEQEDCQRREAHQWEYDWDNNYRLCGKCLVHGRLLKEFVRGDATLGWVRKDYSLEVNRHA